jgi:tRNA1(Val) A37 N6-methylase TrmN6
MQFPYIATYSHTSPKNMYENLKYVNAAVVVNRYNLNGYNKSSQGKSNPLPPKYKGKSLYIDASSISYDDVDGISDWFNEDVRIRGRKSYKTKSSYESWEESPRDLTTMTKTQIKDYRNELWKNNSELNPFRPSWAKALMLMFKPEVGDGFKILDISAGWGDRMIAATSIGADYTGYDPNLALKSGHDKIIQMFGSHEKQKIIYQPFETSEVTDKYDLVISSPPFFDLEIYSSDDTQSTSRYKNFNEWRDLFLIKSLGIAWNALNTKGIMAIHISDFSKLNIVRYMLDQVSTFQNCKSLGVIGLKGESGDIRPVWVWQKI